MQWAQGQWHALSGGRARYSIQGLALMMGNEKDDRMSLWVGGWVSGVDHGLRRPHSPIALSPPQDPQLDGWRPVAQRDALGLTHDQRDSMWLPVADSLRELGEAFMDRVRRNLEYADSLPDGTMIDTGCPCGPHPIEMYR
jgi:hypothetical protein